MNCDDYAIHCLPSLTAPSKSDNMSLPIQGRSVLAAALKFAAGATPSTIQASRTFTSAAIRRIGTTPEGHVKGAKAEEEQFPNPRVTFDHRSLGEGC